MNKPDLVYHSFLERQYEDAQALSHASDLLDIEVLPANPPSVYVATFRCHGLVRDASGSTRIHDHWKVGIRFPGQYLRRAYQVPEILTYLGNVPTPWHPNIKPPFVCLRIEVGMKLKEIIHGLYDLITWNLYASHDALNDAAAQWARQQPAKTFPLDTRPLKWRESAEHRESTLPVKAGGGQ
jgi:hypothetical protein